jgi:hypothetical protein
MSIQWRISINAYSGDLVSRPCEYNTGNSECSGAMIFEETKAIDPKELAEFREKMKKIDIKDRTKVFKDEIQKKNDAKTNFHYYETVNTKK